MRTHKFVFAITAVGFVITAPAFAQQTPLPIECGKGTLPRFEFGKETRYLMTTESGKPCSVRLPPAMFAMAATLDVIVPAKNGGAAVEGPSAGSALKRPAPLKSGQDIRLPGGGRSWQYVSVPGYKGKDSYSLLLRGKSEGRDIETKIVVDVEVR